MAYNVAVRVESSLASCVLLDTLSEFLAFLNGKTDGKSRAWKKRVKLDQISTKSNEFRNDSRNESLRSLSISTRLEPMLQRYVNVRATLWWRTLK